jgi:hypothetical protein
MSDNTNRLPGKTGPNSGKIEPESGKTEPCLGKAELESRKTELKQACEIRLQEEAKITLVERFEESVMKKDEVVTQKKLEKALELTKI